MYTSGKIRYLDCIKSSLRLSMLFRFVFFLSIICSFDFYDVRLYTVALKKNQCFCLQKYFFRYEIGIVERTKLSYERLLSVILSWLAFAMADKIHS